MNPPTDDSHQRWHDGLSLRDVEYYGKRVDHYQFRKGLSKEQARAVARADTEMRMKEREQ